MRMIQSIIAVIGVKQLVKIAIMILEIIAQKTENEWDDVLIERIKEIGVFLDEQLQ
tara:strand:- start:1484 stop:1651 length:168 start_codon:yes stop_codon:yes gene_type:complete